MKVALNIAIPTIAFPNCGVVVAKFDFEQLCDLGLSLRLEPHHAWHQSASKSHNLRKGFLIFPPPVLICLRMHTDLAYAVLYWCPRLLVCPVHRSGVERADKP
jgi:hypothetical protein